MRNSRSKSTSVTCKHLNTLDVCHYRDEENLFKTVFIDSKEKPNALVGHYSHDVHD